jgi:hypothetical protein
MIFVSICHIHLDTAYPFPYIQSFPSILIESIIISIRSYLKNRILVFIRQRRTSPPGADKYQGGREVPPQSGISHLILFFSVGHNPQEYISISRI